MQACLGHCPEGCLGLRLLFISFHDLSGEMGLPARWKVFSFGGSLTWNDLQQFLLDLEDQFADCDGRSSPEDETVAWILVVWLRRVFEVGEDLIYAYAGEVGSE